MQATTRPKDEVFPMIIRLGLFDDHDIVRAGFRYILERHSDIQIVADGGSGREALDAIRKVEMHVCLIDLSLPDLSGIDVLRQAKGSHPEVAIVILSAYPEELRDYARKLRESSDEHAQRMAHARDHRHS